MLVHGQSRGELALVRLLVALSMMLSAFVWAAASAPSALAYQCSFDAKAPYVTGGDVAAKSVAQCQKNTQSKTLKSTLVRVRSAYPDQNMASASKSGKHYSYTAIARGCKSGTHGYKTVAAFTGQGSDSTGKYNRTC